MRVACCGGTRVERLPFVMAGFRMTGRLFERIAALCTRLPIEVVAHLRLKSEEVSEFRCQPGACGRGYRVVVVRKNLSVAGCRSSVRNLLDRRSATVGYVTLDQFGNDRPRYFPAAQRSFAAGVRFSTSRPSESAREP